MGILKTVAEKIEILQHLTSVDLKLAASWVAATDLGQLKGKPFVKATWDQNTVESQTGLNPLSIQAKIETSTLELEDATVLTAVQAMRGKNCSLRVTPIGVVSATNPMIIVKNFKLLIGGELNIGDVSFIKLHGEKPAYDESDVYEYDIAPA